MGTAPFCSQPLGWVTLTSSYPASSAVLSGQGAWLAFLSAVAGKGEGQLWSVAGNKGQGSVSFPPTLLHVRGIVQRVTTHNLRAGSPTPVLTAGLAFLGFSGKVQSMIF